MAGSFALISLLVLFIVFCDCDLHKLSQETSAVVLQLSSAISFRLCITRESATVVDRARSLARSIDA